MAQSADLILKIAALGEQARGEISAASTIEALEAARVQWMGKKSAFTEVMKSLGSVDATERPKIGAKANEVKASLETLIESRKEGLEALALDEKLKIERIDVSLPARRTHLGSLHPVTQTVRKIVATFRKLGFDVVTGPEVETDFLNFEAANIPKDHPARDMQDTFFVGPGALLRTHTTSVQMRAMRSQKPPIRVLCPGAVFRCDSDATHTPMFHQVEGLWVDRDVKMSDLKGVLQFFARDIFGSGTKIRLRPSYFPFVEPGAEVDVSCFACGSKPQDSCRICKGSGWLEILGAGMVHPRLFEVAGYDPREVTGFAFGLGVERIAMLLHEIPDLRLMFQGDTRLLSQF